MNAVQTAPEMVNEDNYRFFIEQTSSWITATDVKLH